MKRLTCEMCGSTDLIKENGVFVCQFCGCKYSIEEAKKMMIEGTVDVSGSTVKIDNAKKLDNLRKLAERAKEENDSETATKYFQQILLEDPNDWEANFYTVYYAAHNIKIAQMGQAANRISNCLGPVLRVIKDTEDDVEKQKEYYAEIRIKLIDFETLIIHNATECGVSDMETAIRNIDNWIVPAISMLVVLGDNILSIFDDYDFAETTYTRAKHNSKQLKEMSSQMRTLDSVIQERIDQVHLLKKRKEAHERALQESKRKEDADRRLKEYWEKHKEEKHALESEQIEIENKIEEINYESREKIKVIEAELTDVLHDKELDEMRKEKDKLVCYYNTLGLFKMKEKKATQQRIDEIQNSIRDIESLDRGARREFDSRIMEIKNETQKRIISIRSRLSSITAELTKPR